MLVQNKRFLLIILGALGLLLIPLIAMQFTEEVQWNIEDFAIAGMLLLGTAFMLEFAFRKFKKKIHWVLIALVIFIALALTWAELAVGIFGTRLAGS